MKQKVINVSYRKDSQTFPEWMKYEIELLNEDGTTEKIPAYGKDLQDALSRVVHDFKVEKIEEQTNLFSGVNVYPNPSNGMFKFIIDSKKGSKMTMRVTNRMGQQVAQNETYLTTGSNKAQLDISSLRDGLYFVNLRAGDEVKSVKIYLAR